MKMNLNKQKGVSLAALLIGMTLGSFLILSIVQVFNTSRQVTSLSKNLNKINQDGRVMVHYLPALIGQTGFRLPTAYSDLGTAFVGGVMTSTASSNYTFFSKGSATTMDCSGNMTGAANLSVNIFKDDDGNLRCVDSNEWDVKLIEKNVDEFFIYAMITDPRFEEFRIKELSTLTDTEKSQVYAVKVDVLLKSPDEVRVTNDTSTYSNLTGTDWAGYSENKKLRSPVEFTVLLPHLYEDANTYIYDTYETSIPDSDAKFAFKVGAIH